jgi:hypothetical protein
LGVKIFLRKKILNIPRRQAVCMVEGPRAVTQAVVSNTMMLADADEDQLELAVQQHARLVVTADISNVALPDQAKLGEHPLLRQMKISGSTVVVPDKPTIIGSVDDPNSDRRFELEVTVTRLK